MNKDETSAKESEIEEVKELLNIKKETTEKKPSAVVFDGKQYYIRIPKRFAEVIGVKSGDKFVFKLTRPSLTSEKEPKLTGEFTRGKE